MPSPDRAFVPGRQHLAQQADLRRASLSWRWLASALAAGDVVRVRRGVYAPRPLDPRPRHLVSGGQPDPAFVAEVRAALLSLGETATAGGRTAAALWGFDMFVEPAEIDVVTQSSRHLRSLKGVQVRRHRSFTVTRLPVLGFQPLAVLSAVDTVIHCGLTRPTREAVVIADSALRSGAMTLEQLQRAVTNWQHKQGSPRLQRMMSLVDPGSGSVLESLARLLMVSHGLVPETQVVLVGATGHRIGRVDFYFRAARLVVECDGRRWHDPDDARERDRVRDNELERAAFRLVRLTWSDVVHNPEQAVALVKDCLEPWPLAA